MPEYGIEKDIGRPTVRQLTDNVDVQNLEAVLAKLETTIEGISETTEELKKIKVGTGLTIGVDLDEEVE